jgi:hypothetical protein
MRVSEPRLRPLPEALALGPAMLDRAREEQHAQLAASLIDEGPALVLGALQHRARVVDRAAAEAAGTRVLRRSTTGTAVYLRGRSLLFTLALPALTTLAPDTSPRTLLNRNLRGFLVGFRKEGALAHYFGREWLSLGHRPAAVVGFEALPGGTTLIELFVGLDAPLAVPAELATEHERAVDRWLGKRPACLTELLRAVDPLPLASRLSAAIAARALLPFAQVAAPEPGAQATAALTEGDPAPAGALFAPPLRVPIGWLDAAVDASSGQIWLGGDLLAATHALRSLAEAVSRGAKEAPFREGDVPLDGAAVSDLLGAARTAASLGPAHAR